MKTKTVDNRKEAKRLYKLPLSELIRVCVADAKKIERSPSYQLNMDVFQEVRSRDDEFDYPAEGQKARKGDVCCVCMGGAVLAKSLKVPKMTLCLSEDVSEEAYAIARALDHVRTGCLNEALYQLGRSYGDERLIELLDDLIKTDFDFGKARASWDTYLKVANALEAFDL